MRKRIHHTMVDEPKLLPQITFNRRGGARALLVFVDVAGQLTCATRQLGPLLVLFALGYGAAGASPLPRHALDVATTDIMAPYRVFTRSRALAMLRYAGPIYGLQVEDVTAIHSTPNLGSDHSAIAEFRFRFRKCEGKAQAHFVGGEDVEGGWRLQDVTELQRLGPACAK